MGSVPFILNVQMTQNMNCSTSAVSLRLEKCQSLKEMGCGVIVTISYILRVTKYMSLADYDQPDCHCHHNGQQLLKAINVAESTICHGS